MNVKIDSVSIKLTEDQVRQLKNQLCKEDNPFGKAIDFVDNLLKGTLGVKVDADRNFINYHKNDVLIFQQDLQLERFYIMPSTWHTLKDKFNLNYEQAVALFTERVCKPLNCGDFIPEVFGAKQLMSYVRR